MLGQLRDAVGQNRDLNLRRAGVLLVAMKTFDRLRLNFLCEGHDVCFSFLKKLQVSMLIAINRQQDQSRGGIIPEFAWSIPRFCGQVPGQVVTQKDQQEGLRSFGIIPKRRGGLEPEGLIAENDPKHDGQQGVADDCPVGDGAVFFEDLEG